MITIILTLMLAFSPADDRKYMEIATTPKGIMVVDGKDRDFLKDSNGGKIWSVAVALEQLEKEGWEYMTVYTYTISDVLSGAFQTESRFLLKKKP